MGNDDVAGQQRRDRNRWWLWCVGGFVLSLGLLLVLGQWFPVSAGVLVGWFVLATSAWSLPTGRPRLGSPVATFVLSTITVIGVGLLVGAIVPNRGDGDLRIEGIVLGAVLTAVGVTWGIVVAKRFSRRQVDAEIERFRREQESPTGD
ncbi:hypothetical protein [Curtobacterium sp. PhB78]|uniref:hypothetical protein n=1 Tax=Curtobacterium sp. PhB78 TaxID=2485102 RepID=UPI000F49AA03|nr:hypothetical protein [Curtobacterium sp. PhB78]ROS36259.1 hypothetical protein EDF53_2226 [Curtobacterium sp. PhB78]